MIVYFWIVQKYRYRHWTSRKQSQYFLRINSENRIISTTTRCTDGTWIDYILSCAGHRPWPSPVHWQWTIEEPTGDTVGRAVGSRGSGVVPLPGGGDSAVATSDDGAAWRHAASTGPSWEKRFRVERRVEYLRRRVVFNLQNFLFIVDEFPFNPLKSLSY